MPQMQFKPLGVQGRAQQARRKLEMLEDGAVLRIGKSSLQVSRERPVAVAAFDLDGTLITTKSGYTFPRDGHDWKLLPGVEEGLRAKLAEMRSGDAQVVCVLFTNQGGAIPALKAKSFINVRTKLEGVADRLRNIDVVYASLQIKDPAVKARFRKPGSGMFDLLKRQLGDIDMDASFFVGDAAGRPQDHSADDKGFAEGAGLRFYTPEEFFGANKTENKLKEPETEPESELENRPKNKPANEPENTEKEPSSDIADADR